MDGSERAVMLKRDPPRRSKEAGPRGGGFPLFPPDSREAIPSCGAGGHTETGTQHRPQALRPKKENPTFSREVLGGATRRCVFLNCSWMLSRSRKAVATN